MVFMRYLRCIRSRGFTCVNLICPALGGKRDDWSHSTNDDLRLRESKPVVQSLGVGDKIGFEPKQCSSRTLL